jgi:aminopeptidase
LTDGDKMTLDELEQRELNTSMIHVDFMIGSSHLSVIGETENGERVDILRDGKWVLKN